MLLRMLHYATDDISLIIYSPNRVYDPEGYHMIYVGSNKDLEDWEQWNDYSDSIIRIVEVIKNTIVIKILY